MTKRNTRSALLVSALAMFLCLTMFVGTTFAWFTDSVTSSGNIIQSGKLDVAMYWADGTKAVPADGSADWTDASTGAIFNYDKWEPGYTEVRHIKIANLGTLALKYELSIIANGEVSKLAEVIDVYFVDPATQVTDRTALTDTYKIGTLKQVLDGMPASTSDSLIAGDKDVVTIALKMQETANNEYQKLAIGTSFSIQLLATQLAYESDSFDDQYDKDADFFIEVNNFADLAKALTTGGKVVLASDITVTAADLTNDPALASIPVGLAIVGTDATIDLNGNDITIAAQDGAAIHVKDGNLTIVGDGTISNTGTSGYVIWAKGASTVNVQDGAFFAGGDDTTLFYASGTVAYDPNSDWATINIYGGTFTNEAVGDSVQDYLNVMNHGVGRINIYGGTFDFDPANTAWGDDAAYIKVAPTYQVIDNGDGTYTVAPPVVANKTEIKNTIKNAIQAGSKETTVDAQGANIGDLNYGINTEMVPAGTTVTIKNAAIEGKSYGNAVAGTVVFENCTFTNTGAYSIHFDAGSGYVVFNNCTLEGWCSFGTAIKGVTFNNCTIRGNGTYSLVRCYQDATFTDCKIDASNTITTDVYQDGIDMCTGYTATMINCTNVNGALAEVFEAEDIAGTDGIVVIQ